METQKIATAIARLRASAWTFEKEVSHSNGRTYFLWSRRHEEGFTSYQLTADGTFPPVGISGYNSLEAVTRVTGINIPKLAETA